MSRGTHSGKQSALPGESTSAAANVAKANIESFHKALCLSRWTLGMFRGRAADSLRSTLDRPALEGWDEENGGTYSKFS